MVNRLRRFGVPVVHRWSVRIVRWLVSFLLVVTLLLVIGVAVWQLRERAAAVSCANNLRALGLALANYESTHKCFPCPAINGVSWRIGIMPFVMSSPMHVEYRYDEPWNSPANLKLHLRPLRTKDGNKVVFGVPDAFHCRLSSANETDASYLLFVGSNAFGNPAGHRRRSEITDGVENTLVAAESTSTSIRWLEPKDMDVSNMSYKVNDPNAMSVSSRHASGPAVLFADWSVYRMSPSIPENYVQALITINGGEPISRKSLVKEGYLIPQ